MISTNVTANLVTLRVFVPIPLVRSAAAVLKALLETDTLIQVVFQLTNAKLTPTVPVNWLV